MHSKLEQKNAYKLSAKFPIYIGSFQYIYTRKCTLRWNKKRLQNKSGISDLFCWLFCSNLQRICREMLKIFFFLTAPCTRRLEKYSLFCYTSRQMHCKLEQKSLQNKTKISYRFFCSNLQCICREV